MLLMGPIQRPATMDNHGVMSVGVVIVVGVVVGVVVVVSDVFSVIISVVGVVVSVGVSVDASIPRGPTDVSSNTGDT